MKISRRRCLQGVVAASSSLLLSNCANRRGILRDDYDYELILAETPLTLRPGTVTPAWTFNGQAPGPVLRVRQNQPVRILVRNHLPEATTIHWHGIRLNNAADGVHGLTQEPIPP